MNLIDQQIEDSWAEVLKDDFQTDSFGKLGSFLEEENRRFSVYPPMNSMFQAFNLCPFSEVKVVILGQDPYHGEGQAHGLAFSVPEGIKAPPSLKNIFKELKSDLNLEIPLNGNLSSWAKQGVLLLNATLSVRKSEAGSHQKKGWEEFTNSVIRKLNEGREGIIFLLWGKFAQEKASIIDASKHFILEAPHPSPFSAHRGFLGCKHFSKTNVLLEKAGKNKIDWQL
jgi:uracil-DNA glycosylase